MLFASYSIDFFHKAVSQAQFFARLRKSQRTCTLYRFVVVVVFNK